MYHGVSLDPNQDGIPSTDFWLDDYFRLWARYHVYGLGILFGWLMTSVRRGNKLTKLLKKRRILRLVTVVCLWLCCIVCLLVPLYLMNACFKVDKTNPDYIDNEAKWSTFECVTSNEASAIWNASFRIMWGTGIGVFVLLCDQGYAFFIQTFLAAKPFHILAKAGFKYGL